MSNIERITQRARLSSVQVRLARVEAAFAVALVALGGPAAGPVSAQCLANEIQKLGASNATQFDHFGTSVSLLDDLAVVGAVNGNGVENGTGAAYVYRLDPVTSQWTEQQILAALDGFWPDEFGFPVAINPVDPTLIIVGARLDDDACPQNIVCNSGSAYIFRFDPDTSTWAQEQKLTASDADGQDRFGFAVSMWGEVAMVGARLDEDPGIDTGSVYVFRYDPDSATWIEEQKLTPSDWQFFPRFGTSVSLQQDVVLIGANTHTEQGFGAGAAYIFRFDPKMQRWEEQQKLQASDATESAFFGRSVCLDGDTALIGAYVADAPPLFNTGAAYAFRFNGNQWIEQQKLTASDGASGDRFGWSVSLTGQTAIIGAPLHDDPGSGAGAAYVYQDQGDGWTQIAKLQSSDIEIGDTLGSGVAISAGRVFVGAPTDDDAGSESGSAYVFGGLGDCNENGELDLCDIADGFSTDKNNNGIPDECESPPCPWDLDNNGTVGASDLLSLLESWGPCKGCPADFDENGTVGASDLLALLANWGPCP